MICRVKGDKARPCKECLWLSQTLVCPFVRCVKEQGFLPAKNDWRKAEREFYKK
jgi:hypothetical protein